MKRPFWELATGLALVASSCGWIPNATTGQDEAQAVVTHLRNQSGLLGLVLLLFASACSDMSGLADERTNPSPFSQAAGVELGLDRTRGLADDKRIWIDVQTAVGDCMEAQGFDYVEVSFPAGTGTFDSIASTDRRSVELYGFGISTNILQVEVVGSGLVGSTAPTIQDDPNLEVIDSLTAAEKAAWEDAMYGKLPNPSGMDDPGLSDEERSDVLASLEKVADDSLSESCFGRADRSLARGVFLEENADLIKELISRAEADPEYVQAENRVAECLMARGFDVRLDEFLKYLENASQAVLTDYKKESFEYLVGLEAEGGSLSNEDVDRLLNEGDLGLSKELTRRLSELQHQETSFALAHFECGGGRELDELFDQIRRRIERELVGSIS